jgi:hypothetical protein
VGEQEERKRHKKMSRVIMVTGKPQKSPPHFLQDCHRLLPTALKLCYNGKQ